MVFGKNIVVRGVDAYPDDLTLLWKTRGRSLTARCPAVKQASKVAAIERDQNTVPREQKATQVGQGCDLKTSELSHLTPNPPPPAKKVTSRALKA